MSLFGIAKGFVKTIEGIVTADGEKVLKGVAGIALSTAGTVVHHIVDEAVGEEISQHGEEISDD